MLHCGYECSCFETISAIHERSIIIAYIYVYRLASAFSGCSDVGQKAELLEDVLSFAEAAGLVRPCLWHLRLHSGAFAVKMQVDTLASNLSNMSAWIESWELSTDVKASLFQRLSSTWAAAGNMYANLAVSICRNICTCAGRVHPFW